MSWEFDEIDLRFKPDHSALLSPAEIRAAYAEPEMRSAALEAVARAQLARCVEIVKVVAREHIAGAAWNALHDGDFETDSGYMRGNYLVEAEAVRAALVAALEGGGS